MLMWLMACSGGEDTSVDELACGALDTVAVAAYEVDDDGQIWLDARGSTACDDALYSWWEMTLANQTSGGVEPDWDILADPGIEATAEAIYAPVNMELWAGQGVEVLLSICAEPFDGACWEGDRLGTAEISFTVPE